MQAQINDMTTLLRSHSEEETKLKAKIRELEKQLDYKQHELMETSRSIITTHSRQNDLEQAHLEKQNLRVKGLDSVVQDLREQLSRARLANDDLMEQNSALDKAQSNFVSQMRQVRSHQVLL